MTPTPDPLRAALNAVVTKTTWRPDNTVLIHDGTAWNTLVGRIVMATNGDVQPAPVLDVARLQRIEAAARVHQFTRDGHWDMSAHNHSDCTIASERAHRAALAEPQS